MAARTGPGKAHREGISLMALADMFPNEESARTWFEEQRWPDGAHCPHCGSANVAAVASLKPMPHRCRDCRKHFSVRTGTVMAESKIPLRKWAFAIYLCATSLKGVSSMKLHRDLDITQKSAWFMAHRIREALDAEGALFSGPVEVDETYIGGKRKNMSNARRKTLAGRGAVGKTAVVGAKDRASNRVAARSIEVTDKPTLQRFVREHAAPGATVYTDEARAYRGMPFAHEAVNHSVGEYVRGMAHTNGMESFWAMLKRGYHGTFHKISPKHLQRYVNEFAGRHGIRDADTIDQMNAVIAGMVGRRLMYRDLVGAR